jgi:hypothetical protein
MSSGRGSVAASTGDMIRTVAILAGVLGLLALAFTVARPDARLPETVDYEPILEQVRAEYPYDVAAPASVPDGWRATNVYHAANAAGHQWRLSFLIGDSGFVRLEQSDGEIVSYLSDRMDGFAADGTSVVGGETWDRMRQEGSPHDYALVRESGGVVTIVRGTESYDVLERFAASLSR